jgi:hypothetical protein
MKSKPRVLLRSAPSGAGHVRAAQALRKPFPRAGIATSSALIPSATSTSCFGAFTTKRNIAMVRPNAAAEIAEDALALVN